MRKNKKKKGLAAQFARGEKRANYNILVEKMFIYREKEHKKRKERKIARIPL